MTAHTYMVGASEGGIVTTLLIERHPELFSAGLAACGPIGDFPAQINYWGDYRALFNYFFPGVIPTDTISPTYMLPDVINHWDDKYKPAVTAAITSHPDLAQQLIRTSKAPVGPLTAATTALSTTLDVMWYNVFATNDGIQELGGNPFDNTHRWYYGSSNDLRLNLLVQRFKADPAAVHEYAELPDLGEPDAPAGDAAHHRRRHHSLLARVSCTASRRTSAALDASRRSPSMPTVTATLPTGELLGSFGLMVLEATGHAPAGIPTADISGRPSGGERGRGPLPTLA